MASNNDDLMMYRAASSYYINTKNMLDETLGLIILIIGLTGNIIIIILMRSKNLSKLTISIYLICLSISDSLVLIFDNFIVWLDLRINSTYKGSIDCKVYYVFYVFRLVSSWIVTTISMDRFLSVFYPQWSKKYLSSKSCIIRIFIIVMIAIIINIHYVVLIETPDSNTLDCFVMKDDLSIFWYEKVWPTIFAIIACIIPSILLIIFNILIIYKSKKSKQNLSKTTNHQSNNQDSQNSKKMNMTVFAICFSFLVLTLPYNIFNIITIEQVTLGGDYNNSTMDDVEYQKIRSEILEVILLQRIFNRLENVIYSINFFLYILTSNLFRHEFFELIKGKCKLKLFNRNNNTTVVPITNLDQSFTI